MTCSGAKISAMVARSSHEERFLFGIVRLEYETAVVKTLISDAEDDYSAALSTSSPPPAPPD